MEVEMSKCDYNNNIHSNKPSLQYDSKRLNMKHKKDWGHAECYIIIVGDFMAAGWFTAE